MRLRHLASAPVAVLAAVLSAQAASAANASPVPWQPYRTAPWTDVRLLQATAENLCRTLS